MSETVVVNLFGGPGAGKSTHAALTFGHLKMWGVNAELVTEYPKDRTWQEDWTALRCQPYILGKQTLRQFRLLGKVDVIVTDSPLLLSTVYHGFGSGSELNAFVYSVWSRFRNLNFLLSRNPLEHPYNPKGRYQDEEEARRIDQQVRQVLADFDVPYREMPVRRDGSTAEQIAQMVHCAVLRREAPLAA